MDEDEVTLDLITYPHAGTESIIRNVVFGPASDKFAYLIEMHPETGVLEVTIGNSPATSELPEQMSIMLREVADEMEKLAQTPQFLEWIYGSPNEDEDDDE